MAGESISIPILTPGADAAARNIKQVGDAAAGTGAKLDFAAVSLKAFNDAAAKTAKADQTLVSSARTHAKALGLVDDAYRVLDGKATVTTKLLADQGRKFDDTGKKATAAAGGMSALAGTGGLTGGGMGALIAAGAVLSPVLVSLGVGAAGFGAAAYGVVKPIEKAAQATGGLQANLGKLDAEQQVVARGILSLGKEYSGFQAALKPTVLHDFNIGLSLAGHLLHDVQPVALAFGKAFGGFLSQIDKMFASGEWQSFFGFMARTVGPDLKLVGSLFVHLASDLPPLIVALQPVATVLLRTADALAATGRAAEQLSGGPLTAMENFGKAGQSIKDSSTGVSGFNAALDVLIGPQQTKSVDNFFHTLHEGFNILTGAEKGALKPTHDTATSLGQWATVTEQVVTQTGRLGKETDVTTHTYRVFAGTTQSVIKGLEEQAHQLNVVAAGYEHALGPLEAYINAQIGERNDLVTLNADLKKSHDAIGLKTAAERASFSDTQTFIDQTIKTGNAALQAHKGIQGQIDVIEQAIPRLEAVRGKTAAYKQELDLLKGILDKLRRERQIDEAVRVTGTGQWSFQQSGVGHAVGPGGAAAGAFVTGGVPGRDSVPIMAMPGEVVVPTRMVSAGAVDHLRGSIPGFASGGIVPSYHGGVAGLPPWTSHNQQATLDAIGVSIARAMAAAFRSTSGFGVAGPGGGAPAANAALARRMMPAWAGGAEWAAWNYVAMRESGWSQFARNSSSGAYGIPQALPPSKMGPAANPPQSNPAAQISWMIGYIRGRYGDPIGAAAHERAFNWYGTGLKNAVFTRPTLIGVGERGPELVNVTPAGRSGAGQTVVVNVTVGHGTHPVAAAQEIIKLLNQGAKSGVKLRTSILGPG